VEQSVRDHCAETERCNQRGGRMLSVVDLIEAGTMTQDTHDTDKETRCWGAGMLIRSISKKTLTPILRSHGWGYLAPSLPPLVHSQKLWVKAPDNLNTQYPTLKSKEQVGRGKGIG